MSESARDPEAIEQDIRRTQDDMSRTVERISDQLSVQNLLSSVFGTGEGGSPDTRKMVEAGKRNPLAVAMVVGGVAWLISGREPHMPSFGGGSSGSSDSGHDPEHRDYLAHIGRVQPTADEDPLVYQRRRDQARADYFMVERGHDEDDTSFRQRLDDATDRFRSKRRAFAEQTRHAGEQVKAGAGQAMDRGQDLFEQNPWAGGLLAAAAGALAGAVLPLSRTEQEQLSGLGGKVREMADEQKDRLTDELRERKDQLVDKAEEKLNQQGGDNDQPGGGAGTSGSAGGQASGQYGGQAAGGLASGGGGGQSGGSSQGVNVDAGETGLRPPGNPIPVT